MRPITILLADDHTVIREGLRAILATAENVAVVAEAENGQEAVRLANETKPDIVVMDVAMPLLNGLGATRQILRQLPSTRILVLSSYGDEDCVQQMLEAGAAGYLAKQTAGSELVRAIHEVRRGNRFFSPAIARGLQGPAPGGTSKLLVKTAPRLTSREAEVLQLVAEGCSNKEVALRLEISIKTVEKHRQQVMNKLNIHEVAGLTRYAITKGMVQPSPKAEVQVPG
jgi:DNA-binding NarL/FixJ family response regulator